MNWQMQIKVIKKHIPIILTKEHQRNLLRFYVACQFYSALAYIHLLNVTKYCRIYKKKYNFIVLKKLYSITGILVLVDTVVHM